MVRSEPLFGPARFPIQPYIHEKTQQFVKSAGLHHTFQHVLLTLDADLAPARNCGFCQDQGASFTDLFQIPGYGLPPPAAV